MEKYDMAVIDGVTLKGRCIVMWVITFEHLHVNHMGIKKLNSWHANQSIGWIWTLILKSIWKLLYLSWFSKQEYGETDDTVAHLSSFSTWDNGETDNDTVAYKCRFSFPIPPMSKTVILDPIDFESEAEENKFKKLGKESGWQPRWPQLGD